MTPRLIIDCHSGVSGNAGLIASLLSAYGIEYTQPDPQVLVATGYGLTARTIRLMPGLFARLAENVADGTITSFKFTMEG